MTTARLLEGIRALLLARLTGEDWSGETPRIAPQIAETDDLTAGKMTITTRLVSEDPIRTFQGSAFGAAVVRLSAIAPYYELADRLAGAVERELGSFHGKPTETLPPVTCRLEGRLDNVMEIGETTGGLTEVQHHISVDVRITRG